MNEITISVTRFEELLETEIRATILAQKIVDSKENPLMYGTEILKALGVKTNKKWEEK